MFLNKEQKEELKEALSEYFEVSKENIVIKRFIRFVYQNDDGSQNLQSEDNVFYYGNFLIGHYSNAYIRLHFGKELAKTGVFSTVTYINGLNFPSHEYLFNYLEFYGYTPGAGEYVQGLFDGYRIDINK
jgi:hypothetical protein